MNWNDLEEGMMLDNGHRDQVRVVRIDDDQLVLGDGTEYTRMEAENWLPDYHPMGQS